MFWFGANERICGRTIKLLWDVGFREMFFLVVFVAVDAVWAALLNEGCAEIERRN